MTLAGRYAILLQLATGAIPVSLLGQQRWERQVQARLDRVIDAVRPSRSPLLERSGALNTQESASFHATLVEGGSYAIVAVCDDDCTHLELTLVTQNGSDVAKDRSSESLPTLYFTAHQTMSYRIRVGMEGCRWNPCWYAVAVIPQVPAPDR